MYATEKYVRLEVKELKEAINQVAGDLGGDITYLNDRLNKIDQRLDELIHAIERLQELNE